MFRIEDLLAAESAERYPHLLRQQWNPPETITQSLNTLLTALIHPIANEFPYPIRIVSGYRCAELNALVGSKPNSLHVTGNAVDLALSEQFMREESTLGIRDDIAREIHKITGQTIRPDVSASYYLWAWCSLRLKEFAIDQLIHEYGRGNGSPAWVHVSWQPELRRERLISGPYVTGSLKIIGQAESILLGTQIKALEEPTPVITEIEETVDLIINDLDRDSADSAAIMAASSADSETAVFESTAQCDEIGQRVSETETCAEDSQNDRDVPELQPAPPNEFHMEAAIAPAGITFSDPPKIIIENPDILIKAAKKKTKAAPQASLFDW